MRKAILIGIFLAAVPTSSIACSCWGTQSIEVALASAEKVVVGRVKGRVAADYSSDHPRPDAMVIEITDSLKGGLKGKIEIAESSMCYRSFRREDLKEGESYVFPLAEVDVADADFSFSLMLEPDSSKAPSFKVFILPGCSHNALLLSDAKLYTNEFTSDGGRRLEYYMTLSSMKMLFATGMYDFGRAIATTVFLIALGVGAIVSRRKRRAKVNSV